MPFKDTLVIAQPGHSGSVTALTESIKPWRSTWSRESSSQWDLSLKYRERKSQGGSAHGGKGQDRCPGWEGVLGTNFTPHSRQGRRLGRPTRCPHHTSPGQVPRSWQPRPMVASPLWHLELVLPRPRCSPQDTCCAGHWWKQGPGCACYRHHAPPTCPGGAHSCCTPKPSCSQKPPELSPSSRAPTTPTTQTLLHAQACPPVGHRSPPQISSCCVGRTGGDSPLGKAFSETRAVAPDGGCPLHVGLRGSRVLGLPRSGWTAEAGRWPALQPGSWLKSAGGRSTWPALLAALKGYRPPRTGCCTARPPAYPGPQPDPSQGNDFSQRGRQQDDPVYKVSAWNVPGEPGLLAAHIPALPRTRGGAGPRQPAGQSISSCPGAQRALVLTVCGLHRLAEGQSPSPEGACDGSRSRGSSPQPAAQSVATAA